MAMPAALHIRTLICSYARFAPIAALALMNAGFVLAEHFPVKTYTAADGLLRDAVTRIKQDSNGFLWFCTADGISRFDGYGFTNFTTDDGLPDRHVNDFLQTRDGTVYLATDGGLARLNTKGISGSETNPLFSIFRSEENGAAKFQVLLEGQNGNIYCGTSDGLFLFDGVQFKKALFQNVEKGPPITSIVQTSDGNIWTGTDSAGIFHASDIGDQLIFRPGPKLPEPIIPALLQTNDGKLWVGLRPGTTGGLCRLDINNHDAAIEKCFTGRDGLPSGWITDLLETRDGTIWVATTSKLCRWQGEGGQSVCRVYTANNGLCDSDIWSLLDDKDGNLWIGSRCGLKKMSATGFVSFNEEDGLGIGIVSSVFEDREGELIASVTNGGVVSRYDNERFTKIDPVFSGNPGYFGWGWHQTALQDRNGIWWVPTGRGLYRSPLNTKFEDLRSTALTRFEFPGRDQEIFRLYEDAQSNLWVATFGYGELWCRQQRDNVWHDYTSTAGINADRYVTAFTQSADGDLWIATGSDHDKTALLQFHDGQFRVFTKAENDLIQGWLRDLFFDHGGHLWVTSTTSGLLRIDGITSEGINISRFGRSSGLASSGVYCAAEDSFGRIYAGTGRGLDRLDPQTGAVENFSTFDGLPDNTVETCHRDRNNTMWFGTNHGLAHLVPEPTKPRRPPTLLITGLRINDASQSVSVLGERNIENIDLDSSQRSVSVDFVGLGATLGERLRYEYSLNDGNWTPTSTRTLNFADLRSGNYTIAIRAVTRDSIASASPTTLRFRIAAPIWQRWWFILGIALATAVTAYIIYRNRLNKLLEIERTRTRIATDLHDDIGSNLSKIALLSELVKMKLTNGGEENRNMLATIADVSRSTVDSMRDIVWSINPQRDSVLEMTRKMRQHAEDILVPRGIAVNFTTGESDPEGAVSMDVRRELFLIFKEAVNNAARHSCCRNVDIAFVVSGNRVSIEMKDDGIGFNAEQPTQSNGLANMQARAKRIGADFSFKSAPGLGTAISVELDRRASAPRAHING
jgi:ligand-binding sensor domain-containing protein/signal transduction histidine kinase